MASAPFTAWHGRKPRKSRLVVGPRCRAARTTRRSSLPSQANSPPSSTCPSSTAETPPTLSRWEGVMQFASRQNDAFGFTSEGRSASPLPWRARVRVKTWEPFGVKMQKSAAAFLPHPIPLPQGEGARQPASRGTEACGLSRWWRASTSEGESCGEGESVRRLGNNELNHSSSTCKKVRCAFLLQTFSIPSRGKLLQKWRNNPFDL